MPIFYGRLANIELMEKRNEIMNGFDTFQIQPLRAKKKLYMQIVDVIVRLIAEGKLEYSSRLYSEDEMMEMLQVSRPTLREALRVLEFLDIVTVRPRKGIMINKPDDTKGYLPLLYILMFEKIEAWKVLELRQVLQEAMAQRAAERRSEEDLVQLAEIVSQMEKNLEANVESFAHLDYDFHLQVIRCAENSLILELMNTIDVAMYDLLFKRLSSMPIDQREVTLDYHRKIYKAIAEQNGTVAFQVMHEHMELSRHHSSFLDEPVQFRLDTMS